MVYLKISKDTAERSLGTSPLPNWTFIGVTLNFPPSMVVRIDRLKLKIAWNMLPPEIQIEWTKTYIERVYNSLFDQMYFSFEISEGMKLHTHILGIVEDCFSNYNLLHVRGRVNINPWVKRHLKYKNVITANYIHFVDGPAWRDYILKDDGKNPFYLYHYTSPIACRQNVIDFDAQESDQE